MSPISLCLNLLLAALLLATLLLGWRLNRQLKALKTSHAGFAAAVGELDQAAARAERGLAELRASTDETMEFLVGRIDKGRDLAAKLERLIAAAEAALDRAPSHKSEAESLPQPPAQTLSRISALQRVWAKPADEPHRAPVDPEAAAESLVLKLSEALRAGDVGTARQALRSRTPSFDDDLFEAPRGLSDRLQERSQDRFGARAVAGGR
jgi:ABC-type transporter Mla subunit MlaD